MERELALAGHAGDVHFERIGAVDKQPPSEAIEIADSEQFVVAWGETTGHRHRVVGPQVRFFRAPDGMTAWALVGEDTDLIHDSVYEPGITQDHLPHRLATGLYEFRRKREATLREAGWRAVED